MKLYCVKQFNDECAKLTKNNSYSNLINDVCSYFKNKTITELHQTHDLLTTHTGVYSLHKYRIKNSKINKGKSSSYRCIAVCLPKLEVVILGFVYAKTGSDGFDNLSKETYKEIAKNIADAKTNNLLIDFICT